MLTDKLIHTITTTAIFAVSITAAVFVFVLAIRLILNIIAQAWLYKQKAVLLEITPSSSTDKKPQATARLFEVLHGLLDSRSFKHKILHRKPLFSLEVVSSRKDGIRFLLRTLAIEAAAYEHAILAYMPDAKVKRVKDYLPQQSRLSVASFKQKGHYAYPIRTQGSLEDHDPIAYLAGSMTKLKDDELVALQLVATPIRYREAIILQHRLIHNELLVSKLGRQGNSLMKVLSRISDVLFGITDIVGDIFHGPNRMYTPAIQSAQRQRDIHTRAKPARALSPIEQQLADSVHQKLGQPLFKVDVRAVAITTSPFTNKERLAGVRQALNALSTPNYQTLKKQLPYPGSGWWRTILFRYRLPSLWLHSANIFATSELASLYHFPHSQSGKTENVIKSLSKQLPAPVSLKNGTDFDVILGMNHYHGQSTPIGLTTTERERHQYVIGGTGNGKTTMLQYQIVQDMKNGKGVAVVDPHGDMAETLLGQVPENRIEDVVYFNPDDLEYPIGLNLLELTPGLTGNELLREKDLVTESVVSVFRKIFSEEDSGGHRIEYILRNTIQTALTVPDATLFTVFDLLNDTTYRKNVTKQLTDKNLINFWNNEFGKAGNMQKVKMAAGITSKIGRFLFSASARQILEQPKSTIDFDDIINSGKILICNFSKGLLGEDTSELFGITVLAKLQLASLRRARLRQSERRAFYLYVDEFQNFATQSFVQMLSESRKYKLFMIMAEQSTSQQDDQQMVSIILANVGTVICFRTGNPQDERVLLPLFSPYIEKGEISNLPSFNFYAKLSAVHAQEPLSGQTMLLEHKGSETVALAIIDNSRKTFAKKQEIEEAPVVAEKPEKPKPKAKSKAKTSKKRAKKAAKPQPQAEELVMFDA